MEANQTIPAITLDRATEMLTRTTHSKEPPKTMVIISNINSLIIYSNNPINTSTPVPTGLPSSTINNLTNPLNLSTVVTTNINSNNNNRPQITGKKKPPLALLLNRLKPHLDLLQQ